MPSCNTCKYGFGNDDGSSYCPPDCSACSRWEERDDITKAKAILSRLEAELKNISAELAIHKTAAFYVDGVGRVLLSVVSR